MNVVGYLVTLANLQNLGGSEGSVKDVSIQVSEVYRLAEQLRGEPEFLLEGFKQNGFYRAGNVGKYLSKNLRDYIYNANVDPRDEGVMLTLYYTEEPPVPGFEEEEEEEGPVSYFLQKHELTPDEHDTVNDILNSRNKRSVLDYLKN